MATVKTFIGNVKGIPGKDGSENQIYSTDEQVIGKWINGKPIYRKVVEYINFGKYSISDLNADTFINIIAMSKRVVGGKYVFVPPYFQSAGGDNWNYYLEGNDLVIRGGLDGNVAFCFIYEYTKTTD